LIVALLVFARLTLVATSAVSAVTLSILAGLVRPLAIISLPAGGLGIR
jgi:hypothetical protein